MDSVWASCKISLLAVLLISVPAFGKKAEKKSLIVRDPEPASNSVEERGLVTDKVSFRSILKEQGRHWSNVTHRHFHGTVLAYVTPWNNHGYDIAKQFSSRFTHVSPVWYQLRSSSKDGLKLTGGHDADLPWVAAVRAGGHARVVPRVVIEGWPLDGMLLRAKERREAIQTIVNECKTRGYDGIVLEAWSAWATNKILDDPSLRSKALDFVRNLGKALGREDVPQSALPAGAARRSMQLIFVIPPPSPEDDPKIFTAADLAMLEPSIDGFSLMTYDFSNAYRPGPNAPLPFVRACLQLLLPHVDPVFPAREEEEEEEDDDEDEYDYRHSRELKSFGEGGGRSLPSKVLLGLNFYGNDFTLPQGGGPIVGHEYLNLLDKHRPTVVWDENAQEHAFSYSVASTRHQVFYPTLKSIAVRLEEARAWGAGISIWEIGQGLDYFYDLL